MLTLAFGSSAKTAGVALMSDGTLLGQTFQNCGLTHSATLLPMAVDLIKNCGVSKSELGMIAVARGPGSFTGVRIGVSTAKGLAWALEIPVCGVSTLEAMAWHGLSAPEGATLCCVMDARREQVYNALFRIRDGAPFRLCPDRAISIGELAEELKNAKNGVLLIGDGAKLCYNEIEGAILPPEPLICQSAWGVAMAAGSAASTDCHGLTPVYIRLSQAERERQEKL